MLDFFKKRAKDNFLPMVSPNIVSLASSLVMSYETRTIFNKMQAFYFFRQSLCAGAYMHKTYAMHSSMQ